MKRKKIITIFVATVIMLSSSTTVFATSDLNISTESSNYTQNAEEPVPAAYSSVYARGNNWILFNGVPSDYQNLNWGPWKARTKKVYGFNDAASLAAGISSLFTSTPGWLIVGTSILNNMGQDMWTQNILNNIVKNAPIVNGKKTVYAKIMESHVENLYPSALAYSKIYVKFYSDTSLENCVGTSDTMCLYAWQMGARDAEI